MSDMPMAEKGCEVCGHIHDGQHSGAFEDAFFHRLDTRISIVRDFADAQIQSLLGQIAALEYRIAAQEAKGRRIK